MRHVRCLRANQFRSTWTSSQRGITTGSITSSVNAISASSEAIRKQQLRERVKDWGNIDLKLVPEFPSKAPCFQDCYADLSNPVYAPVVHVCKSGSGGSMHRVGFILAMNRILKVQEKYVNHIVEIGQCLHNISLVVDDICDDTTQRRGEPCAHVVYGVATSILGAYTTLFNILMSVDIHLGSVPVALEECARMHLTNANEVIWRDQHTVPTEADYMRMVDGKTGGAFRVVTRMLLDLAPPQPDWVAAALMGVTDDVGRFFQIRDDYLDLVSAEFAKKKGGYGSDFKEGKFSFPVIHCVTTRPEMLPDFLEVFKKPAADTTEEDVTRLTKLLVEAGSLDYTLKVLTDLADRIYGTCAMLNEHGYEGNTMMDWFTNLASGTDNFVLPKPDANKSPFKPGMKVMNSPFVASSTSSGPIPSTAAFAGAQTSAASQSTMTPMGGFGAAEMSLVQKLCFQVLELDLTTNLAEIDRVIRQVLACYEVYFRENGLTHKDFWICFPWFLLMKGGIKATADKGHSLVIRRLIKSSPFVDDKFFSLFQKAVEYYRNKQLWIKGKPTKLSPIEMCECKPTNFRIMRWLVHRWYRPSASVSGVQEEERMALENYLAIINAEQRIPFDKNGKHYNIVLHFHTFYGAAEGARKCEAYKAELYQRLSTGGLRDVATRWTEVLRDCAVEQAQHHHDVRIGARDLLKAAFTVARACIEDVELASSTLNGNYGWIRSHFKPRTLDAMFADFMHQIRTAK